MSHSNVGSCDASHQEGRCLSSHMLIHSLEYDRGLNLLDAPDMGDHLFIGRDDELEQMKTILLSDPDSSKAARDC
jgi:hypothetical protein